MASLAWLVLLAALGQAVSLTPCNSGYEASGGGCTVCVKGYAEVNNVCVMCLAGTYSASDGLTECTQCSSGKYSFTDGSTGCLTCVGVPTASTGASECVQNVSCGGRITYNDPRPRGLRTFRLDVEDINDGWYGVPLNTGNLWHSGSGWLSVPYSVYIGIDPSPTFWNSWNVGPIYELTGTDLYIGPHPRIYEYMINNNPYTKGTPIYLGIEIADPLTPTTLVDIQVSCYPRGGYMCAAGKYFWDSSTLACKDCWAGTYSSMVGLGVTVGCEACERGKYSSGIGATACGSCADECPIGFYRSGCSLTDLTQASLGTCVTCVEPHFV